MSPSASPGEFVAQPYFPLLGIAPALGRAFRPDEDQVPQRDAVVVLSDGLWKRRFGGDPGIVGRTIPLDGRGYTVIGVMPPWFRGVDRRGRSLDSAHDGAASAKTSPIAEPAGPPFSRGSNRELRWRRRSRRWMPSAKTWSSAYPKTNEGRGVELSPTGAGDLRRYP